MLDTPIPRVVPAWQPGRIRVLTIDCSGVLAAGATIALAPPPVVVCPAGAGITVLGLQVGTEPVTVGRSSIAAGAYVLAQIAIDPSAASGDAELTLIYKTSDGFTREALSFILPIAGPSLTTAQLNAIAPSALSGQALPTWDAALIGQWCLNGNVVMVKDSSS